MKNDKIKNLTLVALFMALVVIGSRIYIGTHDTFRFHLGNSMCLLSAFVLAPTYAGIASGVGSMLFDILFYPVGGLGCIVTLFTKFMMGFVASIFFNYIIKMLNVNIRIILSGIFGEVVYIILYGIKTYIERRYIMGMDTKAVMLILWPKIFASAINAVIAIVISYILYKLVTRILKPQK